MGKGIGLKGEMVKEIGGKLVDGRREMWGKWKRGRGEGMVRVGVMWEGLGVEMIVGGYVWGSGWGG